MRELKLGLKIGLATSMFWYLFRAFIVWDLFWIDDVNQWTINERGGLACLIICKVGFDIILGIAITKEKKEKELKEQL